MADPQTVPMFAPDGTLGDIPFDKMVAARNAGFKPGVTMKSTEGRTGIIPADRVQEAAKSGFTIVPAAEQESQHPGFWQSLYEDAAGLAKGSLKMAAGLGVGPGADNTPQIDASAIRAMTPEQRKQYIAGGGPSESEQRKAAGYGPLYRAAAPVGEKLGINVAGEEQSAREGDVMGVLGHATALPAAMAAGAGAEVGAPVISKYAQAAADRMATAAKNVTPKQAAQAVGGAAGVLGGHGELSIPAAAWSAEKMGKIAEWVLGKDRANAPIFQKAGSLDEATDALAQTMAKERGAPEFTAQDRAAARSLLQDALKQHSEDVIDQAVPGKNAQAKGAVEYYLRKGDVAQAERALDAGAKAADPERWTPLERQAAPTTNEIRERVQADAKAPKAGSKEDALDTHALQQEMNWNLERHGWSAESEARREFIARNSNYFNKSGKSRGYIEGEKVKLTTTPSAKASGTSAPAAGSATSGDLTAEWQKALDDIRRKQQGK